MVTDLRGDAVGDYIAASIRAPYDWGRDNCALWAAGAVWVATGFDPAADLRGRCGSRCLMMRAIARAGGLLAFVAPRMMHAALRPLDGDGVAVVRVPVAGTLCAILRGGRAVARSERGVLVFDRFDVLGGWSWSKL